MLFFHMLHIFWLIAAAEGPAVVRRCPFAAAKRARQRLTNDCSTHCAVWCALCTAHGAKAICAPEKGDVLLRPSTTLRHVAAAWRLCVAHQ